MNVANKYFVMHIFKTTRFFLVFFIPIKLFYLALFYEKKQKKAWQFLKHTIFTSNCSVCCLSFLSAESHNHYPIAPLLSSALRESFPNELYICSDSSSLQRDSYDHPHSPTACSRQGSER